MVRSLDQDSHEPLLVPSTFAFIGPVEYSTGFLASCLRGAWLLIAFLLCAVRCGAVVVQRALNQDQYEPAQQLREKIAEVGLQACSRE